eukprot:scaffold1090_cov265-Pinguiococcus_pyrenoidosus.AAC.25
MRAHPGKQAQRPTSDAAKPSSSHKSNQFEHVAPWRKSEALNASTPLLWPWTTGARRRAPLGRRREVNEASTTAEVTASRVGSRACEAHYGALPGRRNLAKRINRMHKAPLRQQRLTPVRKSRGKTGSGEGGDARRKRGGESGFTAPSVA